MRSWRDWSWADGNFWDSGVQPLLYQPGYFGRTWSGSGQPYRTLERHGQQVQLGNNLFTLGQVIDCVLHNGLGRCQPCG
jgi:hypothetical protein